MKDTTQALTPLLKPWHIKAIKNCIDENLRIRCINVTTTLSLIQKDRRQSLTLTSTEFNTVPVIHSVITIEDFGGKVWEDTRELDNGEKTPCIKFYINVHARYDGNGEVLFIVSGEVQDRIPNQIFFDPQGNYSSSVSIFDIEKDA